MLSGFSELVVDALMSVETLMHLSMFKGLTTSCQHTVQWNITFNRSSIRSPVVCYAHFSFVDDIGSNDKSRYYLLCAGLMLAGLKNACLHDMVVL